MWDAANVAHACRACLAGIGLTVLPASLAEAAYGPKTTIGANYQQTSDTTSTNGINQGSCASTSSCYVLFQQAPQQKNLIVQHVSCLVNVNTGTPLFGRLWTRNGQTFPLKITHLPLVSTTGKWWVVSSPVMHLVESEEYPLVFFQGAPATWTVQCSISGQLRQP